MWTDSGKTISTSKTALKKFWDKSYLNGSLLIEKITKKDREKEANKERERNGCFYGCFYASVNGRFISVKAYFCEWLVATNGCSRWLLLRMSNYIQRLKFITQLLVDILLFITLKYTLSIPRDAWIHPQNCVIISCLITYFKSISSSVRLIVDDWVSRILQSNCSKSFLRPTHQILPIWKNNIKLLPLQISIYMTKELDFP